MRALPMIVSLPLLCWCWLAGAQGATERLPAYQRVDTVQGSVQLSGSSAVATFARAWGAAFVQMYPGVSVNVVAKSSSAAINDMVASSTTIGMTSRPLSAVERDTYAKQHGQAPQELRVALDAVAIYVFKDNPLKSISMAQLERIFAAAPKDGQRVDHWGHLNLGGDWAERPVNGIGFGAGRGAYETMRELVLRGGDFKPTVTAEPVSTSVVQAVGVDAGAIGYASVYFRTARTRVLPIDTPGGEAALPNERDSANGRYPLARYLYLNLGTPKAGATDSATREFLRFVLSEDGQQLARANGAFAITPALASAQRAGLATPP